MPYFDREQLYRQVWESPVNAVAKLYCLSDVRLHKVCRQLNIPTPPVGYWAKKQAGKSIPAQPKLPSYKGEAIYYQDPEHRARQVSAPEPLPESDELIKWRAKEGLPEAKIQVPDVLTHPSSAIAATQKYLMSKGYIPKDSRGFLLCRGGQHLALNVSAEMLDRALRIYDALLKALKARGMKLDEKAPNEYRGTHILVMGQKVDIALKERATRSDYRPTTEELKEAKRRGYSYFPKWSYQSTGELRFEIGSIHTIGDDGENRLEERLNEVVVALVARALRMKELAQERVEAEHKRQARADAIYQKKRQVESEKARLKGLEDDAARWHRAEQLRAYLRATQEAASRGQVELTPQLEEEIAWGLQKADWLDPLVRATDPILDMKIEDW